MGGSRRYTELPSCFSQPKDTKIRPGDIIVPPLQDRGRLFDGGPSSEHPDADRVCHTGWIGKHPAPLMASVTMTNKYSHFFSSKWKKNYFIVSIHVLFPHKDRKGFALPLLILRSKSKTLRWILFPRALRKICRLWLPCVKCVIFGREMSSVCFGKLRLCLYVRLFPSELCLSPPCDAGAALVGSVNFR